MNSVFLQQRLSRPPNMPTSDGFCGKKSKGTQLRSVKISRTGLYSDANECDSSLDGKVKTEVRSEKQVISDGIGISRFFTGKVVFITGATGFLAKAIVEKILRTLPDVRKIYLLINAKDKEIAMKRLKKEIINNELFKHIPHCQGKSHEEFLLDKLVPVTGNLCESGLGMEVDIADHIADEANIIINSAGNTTFDERYDAAINVNTLGPSRLMSFAKRCKNINLFLHISTAYVNGQREGIILEKQFKIGDSIARERVALESPGISLPSLDVEAEVEMALDARESLPYNLVTKQMKLMGLKRARTFGWQDTYTFTKAMGEMLIERERGDVQVVIIRPSIIESTYTEPIPGWIEGIRMVDPILLSYGKGDLIGFPSDGNTVVDVVPADMVVNATLAAAAKHGTTTQPGGVSIYHIASSVVNPVQVQDLFTYFLRYFNSSPYMDIKGNPINIERVKLFDSLDEFDSYTHTKNVPKGVQHLAKIYEPYGFYKGRFDNSNTEKLLEEMSEEEKLSFRFDVKVVDWKTYWCDIHIPGLMTHSLKGKARL